MGPSKLNISFIFVFIGLGFISCNDDYTPKPRGFQRIDLPKEKTYSEYSSECGFRMQIPSYVTVEPDQHPNAEKCWYNVNYPSLGATLHLSYKSFSTKAELFKLSEDARTLVYKHTIKADEIYETEIGNAYIHGMLYELSGNTATNFQFFIMDSTHHFMRGALYFNSQTDNDSIAPVLAYLKTDIAAMLESLRWK